ncbi:MAG: 4Fe-4S dicluster domain-containing protein [Deltaproteobacteria bacterium]|nr:4Fe-4S dicluster domain-containing protein [Deltaproteobacteria bacterium]
MTLRALKGNGNRTGSSSDVLDPVKDMVRSCIQCGTCTGSCPNSFAMDYTPRRLWRMVLAGQKEEIFKSKTFTLCSACYYCTLRCPRGLTLTEAMGALKQIASREDLKPYKKSIRFYKSFMDSVRRHGRVHEMEFMSLYFLSVKDPFLPLKFTPLGLRLMAKRKVSIEIPSRNPNPLEAIFRMVEELEEIS